MYNPIILSNFNRLFDPFDRMLAWSGGKGEAEDSNHLFTPAVDVKESDTGWLFYADLPGIKANDIDVHVEDDSLVISAKHSSEVSRNGEQYIHTERRVGSYQRRFALPPTADTESISAHHENGLLKILVAKKESVQPKKISVAVN
ncbi:MAG: Hsp20/alpha crystallin family protein [Chromatiales bacterium]|nr:Hsp20/alpha crystallin family protein [Chromatiales bacterium]